MATEATAGETQAEPNGKQAQRGAQPTGSAPSDEYQAALRRAEELLDRAVERVGPYAARAKVQLRTLAARVREEAEDVWAEAQHIRERSRP